MPPVGSQRNPRQRVVSFFISLPRQAIRHPRRVIAIAALVTLVASLGMGGLKLRTDGHALVSRSAPEILYDNRIREHFGIEDRVVVLIRASDPDGIFNPETMQLVRDLTTELARMPGINPSNVISLATEPSFRFRPGTLMNETLLEPPLKTQAELEQLRDDLRRIELYTGTLVASDGQSTVILVGVPNRADRSQLCTQIRQIASARQSALNAIAVTGGPVAESLLGTQILEDLGVPQSLLGAGLQSPVKWQLPPSLHELRLFAAHRIGLVPLAALVMIIIFLLCFRNVLAALLPLPGLAATLLLVFGLMGWCGVPLYLTTVIMPVLLTVISVTNDIYLFNRYFNLLHEQPGANHIELVGETFDKLASPVACTSLTAAVGFFSFGFSPLIPVRMFGVFTGVGALFGLIFSLTVVPALLVLVNPAWLRARRAQSEARSGRLGVWFARAGETVVRRRWWVLGGAVAIIALTPLGLSRLMVQDSWIDGFDPDSAFRREMVYVNNHFFGMHLLFVSFDAPRIATGEITSADAEPGTIVLPSDLVEDPALIQGSLMTLSVPGEVGMGATTNAAPDLVWHSQIESAARIRDHLYARISGQAASADFWERLRQAGKVRFEIVVQSHAAPEIIRSLAELASFLREKRQDAVGGVVGPADYLLTTRFMLRSADPEARRLPDEAAEVKLLWRYYGAVLGLPRLHEVVDSNYWQSLTTVFLKDANFQDTARLMSDLRDYEREHLAPKGIKLGFAGDVAVSQSLIRGIVTTQMQSLIWSLAGIFLVTSFFGGSWRWGFFCLLPSLLAVVIKFAVMGWADIPLGVATSMFAAMTLGIGVNCAIHLLAGCQPARAAGASPADALNRALSLTGPPALINTLAMSLGFGVLLLSQVPANARLGLLLVLGLVNCFVASLLLLPVLLHWWPQKLKPPPATRSRA